MRNRAYILAGVIALLSLAVPALAAPFICHQFEIRGATSLPRAEGDWVGMRADYDITRVVGDTEALLTPDTPTLVRMETLRRAVLYTSRARALAERFVAALAARVDGAGKALALIGRTADKQPHLLKARAAATHDRLFAANMARLQMLQ